MNPEEHSVLEIASSGITECNFFKQAVISTKVPEMSIRGTLDSKRRTTALITGFASGPSH